MSEHAVPKRPHALITGAASGIGAHLTQRLLAEGWAVAAADLAFHHADRRAAYAPWEHAHGSDYRQSHDALLPIGLDVRREAEWRTALEMACGRFGPLRLLINNAGIIVPGRVHRTPLEALEQQVDVNLKGVMIGTRLGAACMLEDAASGKGTDAGPKKAPKNLEPTGPVGHIINIASMAGVAPVPGLGAYSASKFGVRAWSLTAAEELRSEGIAVSVLCPDLVDTPMLDAQLDFPEAAITFSGPGAMSQQRIGDAVLEMLRSKPRERLVPASRGWLAKLASAFPSLMPLLRKRLEAKGGQQQMALRRSRPKKA